MWRKLQDTGIWRRLLCPYVCPRLFSYANVFGEHGPLHLIELICIHTRVVNTCCNTIPIYYKHEQSCCIYGLNTVYPWHEFQFKNYKLRWLIELKSTASIVLVQRFLKNHQWFIISKQCASAWVILYMWTNCKNWRKRKIIYGSILKQFYLLSTYFTKNVK